MKIEAVQYTSVAIGPKLTVFYDYGLRYSKRFNLCKKTMPKSRTVIIHCHVVNYFPSNRMGKNMADFRPYSIASVLCSLVFRHPALVHRPRLPPPHSPAADHRRVRDREICIFEGEGGRGGYSIL